MTSTHNTSPAAGHEVPYSFKSPDKIVKWIGLGTGGFTDPFFNDTIQRCRRDGHEPRETALDTLLATTTENTVRPSAFIFHTSRCGSTLVAQMLAQSPANIVLSEPGIVDDLLLSNLPDGIKQKALVKTLQCLGRKRHGLERHLIIKLDCWHLIHFDFIKKTFPGAPVIFIFREPSQIIASHRRMRGRHMVPGLLNIAMVDEPVPSWNLDGYAIKVLEKLFSIMNRRADQADLLLDYRQLPHGLSASLKRIGLTFSQEETATMAARMSYSAKEPDKLFEPPQDANPPITGGDMDKLYGLYAELSGKAD